MNKVAVIVATAIISLAVITAAVIFSRPAQSNDVNNEIAQIIIDRVEFPNGSYVIALSTLGQASADLTPIILNSTTLKSISIHVDPTNDVLVTNRKTFLYVALPSAFFASQRKRRSMSDSGGICIGLGTSNANCRFLPMSIQGRGFFLRGYLQDGSKAYQIPITAPSTMCPANSDGQCSSVDWTAYAVNGGAASPPSRTAALSAACGNQCQSGQLSGGCMQSCYDCDGKQVSGANTPLSKRYHTGKTKGTFLFDYQTYNVPDRIRIFQDDVEIFDSGCVGTIGEQHVSVQFNGKTDEIRVDVEPNCDGTTNTEWYFTVWCPSSCDDDQSSGSTIGLVSFRSGFTDITTGSKVYIDEDANMPSMIATYCPASQTASVSWTFTLTKSGNNDNLCQTDVMLTSISDKWDITADLNGQVRGGLGRLSWTTSGGQNGDISFTILGRQPDRRKVMSYISDKSNQWYAQYIAMHESTQHKLVGPTQFCNKMSGYSQCRAANDGYPMKSFDNGYGAMQLTYPAPTCVQIWSWKANCDEGVRRLNNLTSIAVTWMNKQRNQAQQDTGRKVPVPKHVEANCVFEDETNRVIEDAVTMKMYNGAKLGHFCAWNNTEKKWKFNTLNSMNFNYVERICRLVPS